MTSNYQPEREAKLSAVHDDQQSREARPSMQAGQWSPHDNKVIIRKVPIPQPGPSQFLIKMASASLCHSDVMSIDAGNAVTLGHEGAGYIATIHESVKDSGFNEGDRVGFLYTDGCCYRCEGCQIFPVHCVTGKQKLHGFSTDGFFAEYAVVDAQNCIHLPHSIDVQTASPYFCAGLTAFHSVDSCELEEDQWLAVIGGGGLGQFAIQIAKAMKLKVIAVDVNDETLDVCKQLGADAIFNSKSNGTYITEIKQLTDGGVSAACVCSNADAAYASAPSLLRLGGLLMVVGIPYNPIPTRALDLALRKYRIMGENTGTPQRMQKGIDFFAEHGIKPEVQFRRLGDLDDMVKEMKAGTATKRMLVVF